MASRSYHAKHHPLHCHQKETTHFPQPLERKNDTYKYIDVKGKHHKSPLTVSAKDLLGSLAVTRPIPLAALHRTMVSLSLKPFRSNSITSSSSLGTSSSSSSSSSSASCWASFSSTTSTEASSTFLDFLTLSTRDL